MPVRHSSLAKGLEAGLLTVGTESSAGVKIQRFKCQVGPRVTRERITGCGLGTSPGPRASRKKRPAVETRARVSQFFRRNCKSSS